MDAATRRELEACRAQAIELCEQARAVAERVVQIIDTELAEDDGRHRKPRHLSVVKGLVAATLGLAALRKLAAITATSAVTAAMVTFVTVPLVVPSSPAPPPSHRVVPTQVVRPVTSVPSPSRSPGGGTTTTLIVPSPSPQPADPSPSPSPKGKRRRLRLLPSPSPSCLVNLLRLVCVP